MELRPIPIAEQLPDTGVDVLAYESGRGWWQARYCPGDDDPNDGVAGWCLVGIEEWADHPPITHWQPMPRAPR